MLRLSILLSVALLAVYTSAYKKGAPKEACEALHPKHKDWKGQATPSPFKFEVKKAGDTVEVQIKITDKTLAEKFKGFLITAKDAANKNIGTWEKTDKAKLLRCENDNDAITHESNEEKETIKLKWKKPDGYTGTVCFKGAVVKDGRTFWVNLKSSPIDV